MSANLLKINANSKLFSVTNKRLAIAYLFLLSLADDDFTLEQSHRGIKNVRKELDELIDMQFIYLDTDGNYLFGDTDLFINEAVSLVEQENRLSAALAQYRKRRVQDSAVVAMASSVLVTLSNPEKLRAFDLMTAWRAYYSLTKTTRYAARDFNKKEAGQFTHFLRYFGGALAIKMIFLYIDENDVASIGGLLSTKDEYFAKINKLETTANVEGTKKEARGFY